ARPRRLHRLRRAQGRLPLHRRPPPPRPARRPGLPAAVGAAAPHLDPAGEPRHATPRGPGPAHRPPDEPADRHPHRRAGPFLPARHPAPDVLVPGVLADPGPDVLTRGVPGVALPAVVPRLPGLPLVPDLPVRALPPGVAPRLGGPEPGRRPAPSRT